MREEEVSFVSAGLRLAGTLAFPSRAPDTPSGVYRRAFPAVLMIPGSGPVDRNESAKRFPLNIFGQLAEQLAEEGFCSLRYDKRGVGASEGNFWNAGFFDNIADAEAALVFLRAHKRVKAGEVFVLGHSEGAYIATRLAAEHPELAGVVLIAGGARSPEEELKWQARRAAETLTGLPRLLAKLLRLDLVRSQEKQIQRAKQARQDSYRVQLFGRVNAKWLRELLSYDPTLDLSRISCPTLALAGAKDIQVDPGNLERMAELVKAPFAYHLVPDLTHLLRAEAGQPTLTSYRRQARQPVDPRVMKLVLEWLKRQPTQIKPNGSIPCSWRQL